MSPLEEAAKKAIKEVLDVKEDEEVLIITNFEGDVYTIAKSLYEAVVDVKGKPVMLIQPEKSIYDLAERSVLEAIRSEPDVVITISSKKLGKDPFGLEIGYIGHDRKKHNHIFDLLLDGNKQIRSFWSPGANVDMFERCVPIDYVEMRSVAAKLKLSLDGHKKIRITSPMGTDLTISIDGRKAKVDDGNYRMPGLGGNLPCGEVYICPQLESAEGVVFFDGTIDLTPNAAIPDTPVKVVYSKGYVTEVSGGVEAKQLLQVIEKGEELARARNLKREERNARALGELGIGINYSAKMTCNMLEDEKVGKTVHLAIGANYDNDGPALIHQDCLVLNPSVWIDEKQIMKNGLLLL